MSIAFRVDSSVKIGTGHLMRCLTLADGLRSLGHQTWFISRDLPGNSFGLIESHAHGLIRLPKPLQDLALCEEPDAHTNYLNWLEVPLEQDSEDTSIALKKIGLKPDWLVIDHYALDGGWENAVRASAERLFAIDDLANRNHRVDLLLDVTPETQIGSRQKAYEALAPSAQLLIGPSYSLIREEFRSLRALAIARRASNNLVRRILISFGGIDRPGLTLLSLQAIERLKRSDLRIDVVFGSASPHREKIREYCQKVPGARPIEQASNMAELMFQADLAIGSGGTTVWERACLGLPSLAILQAENQRGNLEGMSALGALKYLGSASDVSIDQLTLEILKTLDNPELLHSLAEASFRAVDGNGIARIEKKLTY